MTDWMEAQDAANNTATALKTMQEMQAERRHSLQTALNQLDKEIRPFTIAKLHASQKLNMIKDHLLDPCKIEKDGRLIRGTWNNFGSKEAWCSTKAWLRVAKLRNDTWKWAVNTYGNCGLSGQLIFGPLSDNPTADFEKYRLVVEELLADKGYLIVR